MKHAPLFAALLGAAGLVSPGSASAYCRTTTTDRAPGMCPEECLEDQGLKLFWGKPNPEYQFNERGFPDLDMEEAVDIVDDAFDRWNNIKCEVEDDDGDTRRVSIGLDIDNEGTTTELEVGPEEDEPNENVIVFFDGDDWREEGFSSQAYALTAIWFNKLNGEILGADMHFNGGMGELTRCPNDGCAPGKVDLGNVATHEAGHFIGLAHSAVEGSTMWCSAEATETEKRTLSDDDIEGACAIYPPNHEMWEGDGAGTPPRENKRYCSVSHGAGASLPGSLLLVGLGLSLLHRRRR